MVTPPVYNPIIIPMIHREITSRLLSDLDNFQTHFFMFLPRNQAFSVNYTASDLLQVKYMRIQDAEWVNVPGVFEFSKNDSLSFVTSDKDIYNAPKRVTFSFALYRGDPLTFYFSSQIITLEEVTYLPTLSSDDKLLVYGVNFVLIGLPLANLVKDRKKSFIKTKQ